MPSSNVRRRITALATTLAVGAISVLVTPAHAESDSAWGGPSASKPATDAHATPFDYESPAARSFVVRKWPRGQITYFDATKDKRAVAAAVKIWNTSGLKIRFRKIANRKKAKIVIRNSRRVPNGCGTGLATVGYQPRLKQGFVNILHGTDADGQPCSQPGQTLVIAHELGHILGLRHDDTRCSLMNSSHTRGVAPTKCLTPGSASEWEPDEMPGHWRCRVTEKIDLQRVKKMYGGRPRPVRANPWCELYQRMPSAGPLAGEPTVAAGAGWGVTMQRPPEPSMPAYLFRHAQYGYFELHLTQGTCSTAPATVHNGSSVRVRVRWSKIQVNPGGVFSYTVPTGPTVPSTDPNDPTPKPNVFGLNAPGPWCVTNFAFDELARQALAPTYLDVTVL